MLWWLCTDLQKQKLAKLLENTFKNIFFRSLIHVMTVCAVKGATQKLLAKCFREMRLNESVCGFFLFFLGGGGSLPRIYIILYGGPNWPKKSVNASYLIGC